MRSLLQLIAGALVFLIAGGGSARAEHFDSMTAELDALRARIAQLETGVSTPPPGCGDTCCCTACDPCVRSSGIIGGAELTYVSWHGSGGEVGNLLGFDDYLPAWRVWAGWQDADGLGVRVRYWEYDHSRELLVVDDPEVRFATSREARTFDLEVVDSSILGCYWDVSWFGGVRYLQFRQDFDVDVEELLNFDFAYRFEGVGLTLGGEIRRPVTDRFGVFANTRASLLYGDQDIGVNVLDVVDVDIRFGNSLLAVFELQTGVEARHPLPRGGFAFARGLVEAQFWHGTWFSQSDSALIGFGASLGICR